MNNKHVMILVAVGAALAALAWLTSREAVPGGDFHTGAKLLPGLDVNAVHEILITTATDTTRIVRAESGWQLPDRYYHPADFGRIRQFLIKLDRLTIGQAVVAGESQREQMGLREPSATVITLGAEDRPPTRLYLGAPRQAPQTHAEPPMFGGRHGGRYVAVEGQPVACLIDDMLHEVSALPVRWMETTLLDVNSASVTAITFENPKDGVFRLRKDKSGQWGFDPATTRLALDDTKVASLTGVLSFLTVLDVADPVLTDAVLGFTDAPWQMRVQTENGTRYDIRVSVPDPENGERYIRVGVGFEAPSAFIIADGEGAQGKALDMIVAAEETQTAADALHQKLSPWTYRLSAFKADIFSTRRESLIKPPEARVEDDDARAGTSAE